MVNFGLWSKESDGFFIPPLIIPLGVNSGRGNTFMILGVGGSQPFKEWRQKSPCTRLLYMDYYSREGLNSFLFP